MCVWVYIHIHILKNWTLCTFKQKLQLKGTCNKKKYKNFCISYEKVCNKSRQNNTWAVQKVSDLWSAKIQLFILTSETLIPFKLVSLVMHTLLPAVLPLLETFLESFLWNLVQLGHRTPHNVFS